MILKSLFHVSNSVMRKLEFSEQSHIYYTNSFFFCKCIIKYILFDYLLLLLQISFINFYLLDSISFQKNKVTYEMEEIAQIVKCLQHEHEDLSLDFQHPYRNQSKKLELGRDRLAH